jgi:DNA-formamidopyrimidine glycosylase
MPEGPEVKRMAMGLARETSGRLLVGIDVLSGRYAKKPLDGLDAIGPELPLRVVGVGCHGKFMYLLLEGGWSVWSTLGMTGGWSVRAGKHARVRFAFEDGEIHFNDQRNFGTLAFRKGPNALRTKLASLGPDIMARDFDAKTVVHSLRKRDNWNVCKALMDQSVVAGIGNYVKAEALWLSSIDPWRNVGELTDAELLSLVEAANRVCEESFRTGGATIRTYRGFDGNEGEYADEFMCYGQRKDPDGNEIIRETTPDGRTTHWAPKRQRKEG